MKALAIPTAVLLWLAAACSAPAQPSEPAASGGELFVADVREAPPEMGLQSSIELKPDGTFDWRFSTRELALSAHGNWHRDSMLHLENPDQVGEPSVELAASARNPGEAVRIALDPATRPMASVLEAELEYPDDVFARVPLTGGWFSIPAGEDRPVAVRLFSEAFSFRSQPIALAPDGDNDLTLRLVPADFGQAFFGSQQTGFDAEGMTIDWRGIALRYNRAAPRDAGAPE